MSALSLLIIAHGQPSAPDRAEAELARLARSVARHWPGRVAGATLAAPGTLARAVGELGERSLAYPLFMAGGWFTRVHLPARLTEAGAGPGWRVLEPLGCDPALHDLAALVVAEAGPASSVVLAAHGSGRSPAPALVAAHVARLISQRSGIARVEPAFIDQSPRLDAVSGHGPAALCLPFFAAGGDHVTDDLPAALARAGFAGRLLPALGLDPRLPALIAAAARAALPICATTCHWQTPLPPLHPGENVLGGEVPGTGP